MTASDEFLGEIGIEWPPASPDGGKISGWQIGFYDENGPVHAVRQMTLHASADGVLWAELIMFADADGNPVRRLTKDDSPSGQMLTLGDDGHPLEGRFRFLVTSMRTREAATTSAAVASAGPAAS